MVSTTQSITRMLAEISDLVADNSLSDKQYLKKEIRDKKAEIKESYRNSTSTQQSQGILYFASGGVTAICLVISAIPNEYVSQSTKDVASKLIPELGSQITRGIDNRYNGRVTSYQGISQVGQKEMDLFQTRLQDAGNLEHKAQQMVEEAQRSEEQIVARG